MIYPQQERYYWLKEVDLRFLVWFVWANSEQSVHSYLKNFNFFLLFIFLSASDAYCTGIFLFFSTPNLSAFMQQ